MISKLILFLVLAVYAIQLKAQSSGNSPINLYHACNRSMNVYLQLKKGIIGDPCAGGPKNNQCRPSSGCTDPNKPLCCQNENSCNECTGKKSKNGFLYTPYFIYSAMRKISRATYKL